MNQKFIAKIEGHGNLTIDWQNEKVQLNLFEGERLFEAMVLGRQAEEFYWITPRICGVCPVAHNMASLKAVEAAFGIEPNETTTHLRRIMLAGQMIQSHVLHLYFLSLPDYLGIDRGTELKEKNPQAFMAAIRLKEVSDLMVQTIGGRGIHPITTTLGGFNKLPSKKSLSVLAEKLEATEKDAQATAELCASIDYPKLEVDFDLLSHISDKPSEQYCVYYSKYMVSIKNGQSNIQDYKKVIEEEIRDYSTAKFSTYKKQDVMVGSLARVVMQGKNLVDQAKPYSQKINYKNPFHNNLAQGIEVYHFHQRALVLIKELLKSSLNHEIVKPSAKPSLVGIGAVEAPRGGLYHEVQLDKKGIIKYANIITPTVQNLMSIEKSATALLNQTKNLPQSEREKLLNMLVRAYDPCITCSVH